jgi:nitroreductase
MENVMTVARAHGLETCPQQAWCSYAHVVRRVLGLGEDVVLLSGMSLGHEDKTAPENRLVTEREPVDGFTTWHR